MIFKEVGETLRRMGERRQQLNTNTTIGVSLRGEAEVPHLAGLLAMTM